MLKSNLILLLLIIAFQSAFSQDKLIRKDGTTLEVKIIEISSTEIKYKLYDNLDGPVYLKPKYEFVRAEYKNGDKDIFKSAEPETPIATEPKAKKIREGKISDWIRFNVEAGAAYAESFNAIPVRLDQTVHRYGNGNKYSRNPSSKASQVSPYLGMNFLFGKDEVVTHLIGASYLNVKTSYNLTSASGFNGGNNGSSPPPYYAQSTDVSVSGSYHLLAVHTGLNFNVGKGFNIGLLASVGGTLKGTLVSNGNRVEYITVADTVFPGTSSYTQTVLIENEKSEAESINFCSIQGKISYDFKIKENVLGVFLLGNVSVLNRLPYCAVGLTYYPFKKLRASGL